jgi:CO/xanthine dehydrogenase Mo-binding subunit
MEPMNCTAYVQKDRCDVWAPMQGQTVAQMVASHITELPPDKVNIPTTLLGCGLGRQAVPDFVAEAVITSKIMGKPVKLVWSREEDIKYDFYRAATRQKITGGLDSQGGLTGWSHKAVAGSIMKDIDPKGIINGVDIMSLWGIVDLALSTTLKEQIRFANGGAKTSNFDDYKIFKMSDVPEIEVHIVKSTEAIGGIGEPGVPPVAPAVANAVFNTTGARIRRIPLTPEIVLAAIKAKKA